MDALLAVLIPVLPELGGGGLLIAFAVWRERAHNAAHDRWVAERATLIGEKKAAVAAQRAAWAEDDQRRDQRIAALAAENDALERRLDEERAARRFAEDVPRCACAQRHRAPEEGITS